MSLRAHCRRRAGSVCERVVRLWRDQDGLTATEYSLLLALLIVAAVAAFSNLGSEVQTVANDASEAVHDGGGMGCSG